MSLSIYLASSWRNPHHADVLAWLRAAGHDVYDFKAQESAFNWREVTGEALDNAPALQRALEHPVARAGFRADFEAMKRSQALVLLLPCGLSAHLEAGWAAGRCKPACVLAPPGGMGETRAIREPELMYRLFDWMGDAVPVPIFETREALADWIALVERMDGDAAGRAAAPLRSLLLPVGVADEVRFDVEGANERELGVVLRPHAHAHGVVMRAAADGKFLIDRSDVVKLHAALGRWLGAEASA